MNEEISMRDLLASLFIEKPTLFSHLFEFNFLPASYVHPSRMRLFFDGAIPEKIWSHHHSQSRLSQQILKILDLETITSFEILIPESACILLPLPKFRNLARHIGAVMIGSSIRSSLGREDVLQWKKELGSEVFAFVMHRGTLFPDAHIDTKVGRLGDVERLGGSLILSGLNGIPEGVYKRVMLKLHIDAKELEIDKRTAKNLINSVLFLLEREWHSLFVEKKAAPALMRH